VIEKHLVGLLKSYRPASTSKIEEIATAFQAFAEQRVADFWSAHNNEIPLEIDGVKIGLEGSSVNSSTALGFVLEEMIIQYLMPEFERATKAKFKSSYDCRYVTEYPFDLVVNLKVESKNNSGIASAKNIQRFYSPEGKTKLYLILKSRYKIDEKKSSIRLVKVESIYLEEFLQIPDMLKSDSRNWSSTYKILSGRLLLPSKRSLASVAPRELPAPEEFRVFVENLGEHLIEVKRAKTSDT